MIQIPPKSIVVNTHEILSACEIAEVMNHHHHHQEEMTTSGNNTTTTTITTPTTSQVAMTQMAILLHLGNYTHARHLWRRYKSFCTSDDDEWNGLKELWNVGQAMMDLNFEQVYQYLLSQQSSIPWKDELCWSYRNQMISLFQQTHDTISVKDCQLRLGFHTVQEQEQMNQWLQQQHDWEYNTITQHWIPALPQNTTTFNTNDDDDDASSSSKIHTLSKIVHFLEQKQLNV